MTDAAKISLSPEILSRFRKSTELAARAGGERLLHWMGKVSVKEKNPGDLVTQADLDSQKTIRDLVTATFPDHLFLGEEDDGSLSQLDTNDFCWIVDPLDGTTNFVHEMRSFGVSVALAYQNQVIAGTVFAPALDECYSAALGQGATFNGSPIRVSECGEIGKALLVCSFKSRVGPDDPQISRFARVVSKSLSVRRLGSAALNLCYVAAGKMDGYWADCLKIWEVAAGTLIMKEAGGVVSHINGQPFDLRDPKMLVSASPELHEVLLDLLETRT